MTEKRYVMEYVNCEVSTITDTVEKEELTAETIVDLLNTLNDENEQLKSVINTLGIGISKMMQSIKEDREHHALILGIEILKKLEENGFMR